MPETVSPVVEDAPAKINLALHVTGKRPDGYHLLESLVVFTRFGDRLTASLAEADSLHVTGPFGEGLPVDQSNLVSRARDAFREQFPLCPPVKLVLEKNLPLASGIGGGSSDAAATLRALSRLCGNDIDLAEIGISLGADVPMCLAARPLIAKGIGENLRPVANMPELPMVLVNPGTHVPTPAVFSELASASNPPLPSLPEKLDFTTLIAWLNNTRNDLQPAAEALAPAISETMAALQSTVPAFARMSGSGATCFGIYENRAIAERAAFVIRARSLGWFVAVTPSLA